MNRPAALPDFALRGTYAEDVLLDWLLLIPDGVDPGDAARIALAAAPAQSGETAFQRKLRSLLAEVGRAPRASTSTRSRRLKARRR